MVSVGGVRCGNGGDASSLPVSLHLALNIILCLRFLNPVDKYQTEFYSSSAPMTSRPLRFGGFAVRRQQQR